MADAFDLNVARVVTAAVTGEVVAGGWFHVYAGEGTPVGGGALGMVATAVDWLRRKQAWRWPVHAYWAATGEEVWVLDLNIGSGVELGRVIGHWQHAEMKCSPGSAPNRVVVQAPGRPPVEIEGDRYDQGETRLIGIVCGSA